MVRKRRHYSFRYLFSYSWNLIFSVNKHLQKTILKIKFRIWFHSCNNFICYSNRNLHLSTLVYYRTLDWGNKFSVSNIFKVFFSACAMQLVDAPVSISSTALTPLIRDWQIKCLVLVNFSLICKGGIFLNKE